VFEASAGGGLEAPMLSLYIYLCIVYLFLKRDDFEEKWREEVVGTTLTISFALAIAQGELHSMKGHDATIRGYDDLRQKAHQESRGYDDHFKGFIWLW
jgi:hypothetical protein